MRIIIALFVSAIFLCGLSGSQKDPGAEEPTRDTLMRASLFSHNLFELEISDVHTGKPRFDPAQTLAIRNGVTDPSHLSCSGTPETCTPIWGSPAAEARYLMENFRASTLWIRTSVALQSSGDHFAFRDKMLVSAAVTWTELRTILCSGDPAAHFTDLLGDPSGCKSHQ